MNRRAFTLIELLASIAVMATLMALALPAMSGARESGKRAVCLAGLQGFGRAFILYRSDHEELLPFAEFPISIERGFLDPLPALAPYLDRAVPRVDERGRMQTGAPYTCPSDPQGPERGVSYVYPPYEVMALAGARFSTLQHEIQPYLPIFQDDPGFHHPSARARNVLLIDGTAEPYDPRRHRFTDW